MIAVSEIWLLKDYKFRAVYWSRAISESKLDSYHRALCFLLTDCIIWKLLSLYPFSFFSNGLSWHYISCQNWPQLFSPCNIKYILKILETWTLQVSYVHPFVTHNSITYFNNFSFLLLYIYSVLIFSCQVQTKYLEGILWTKQLISDSSHLEKNYERNSKSPCLPQCFLKYLITNSSPFISQRWEVINFILNLLLVTNLQLNFSTGREASIIRSQFHFFILSHPCFLMLDCVNFRLLANNIY